KILTFKDAINVSMQVAEGLNVVHNEGWAHLDIKPGNFFYEIDIKRGYVAKLADFDFAEDLKNAKSNRLLINGTPGYRSPEMTRFECMGLVGGQQNDIFSLGISMLELAGFSIWHNFVNDDNNSHKTQEEVLDAFEALMSNFKLGSPEYSKVQTEFYKYVANTNPQDYQKSYLNLAGNMINPDASRRPKIIDVVLELKLLDLATT
nr:protein kinase [Parachlamydiaceae bacterium]